MHTYLRKIVRVAYLFCLEQLWLLAFLSSMERKQEYMDQENGKNAHSIAKRFIGDRGRMILDSICLVYLIFGLEVLFFSFRLCGGPKWLFALQAGRG